MVSRRAVLVGLAAVLVATPAAAGPSITVHRDPT
jgi:hypothetical protein